MLKSYTTKLLLAAACLLSLSTAYAASATGNLSVSASVTQKCTIATTALAFGTYDPVVTHASTALTGTGAVALTCTKSSTGVTITLGLGGNASGSTRRLNSGTDYLNYELYQPSAATPGASCPGTTV
ncbi:MAG TPA: spore coat protein U domain-containing protein, partial [Burkholderiales bacterium]|nr:spore coat protein U domain-containing protein [Burkholderiales bacterium]